ncbi:AraC family transcriptional regulator [Marinomonas piezotolerans]|uniref:AraC family transcriptional regulator n=1 Tax=Marinomonas piezotolerans TaxID=2213058 RepID=A0A370UCT4_9GAMM|nr:AraC family transcriptional regulator [Marinomonas piezotolerans]RDL45607.1 AraC family transcriptional regulator [Marinomonas piezotolerans]
MNKVSKDLSIANIRSKQPWFVFCSAGEYSVKISSVPFISHFYSFEAKASVDVTNVIPDGCIDILFDCDSSKPSAIVCGTTLEAQSVDFIHQHRYFGVRMSPACIPNFLDISASDLVNQRPSFDETTHSISDVFENIVSQGCFTNQVDIFSDFLIKFGIRNHSTLTQEVIAHIFHLKGDVQITNLEALTGYTSRTIQRQFINDTGITPKAFCRIVRCQFAIYNINLNTEIKPSDIAYNLGFYDQSHFSREFKSLLKTTPNSYINHLKNSTYLEKIRFH